MVCQVPNSLNAEFAEDSQRTQRIQIKEIAFLCVLCANFATSAFKKTLERDESQWISGSPPCAACVRSVSRKSKSHPVSACPMCFRYSTP